MKTTLRAIALGALLAAPALGGVAFAADNPMVGGAAMYADKDIIDNAVNSADHTTLVAAVKAAGLVDTLKGPGPFTVLAPTNEAFDALPAGTVDTLLKPESKDMLTSVLECHVISGTVTSADLEKMISDGGGMYTADTLGPCKLTFKDDNGKITVTDENGTTANVSIPDVMQSNGVIHVIDAVLTPKS